MNHYEYEFLKQIHVVILGLDVLGNPYGIIRGVAEGVKSFFYEPIKVNLLFMLIKSDRSLFRVLQKVHGNFLKEWHQVPDF